MIGVDDVDFSSVPANGTDIMTFLHHSQNTLENHEFLLLFFAAKTTFHRTGHAIDLILDLEVRNSREFKKKMAYKFNILLQQFLADNIHITARINTAFDVSDILAVKTTENMENGINSTDVRQESISKTTTFGSTLDKTGNIGNLQNSRNVIFRLKSINHEIKTLIRNGDTSDIRIDGTERIVFGRNLGVIPEFCQRTFNLDKSLNKEDLPTLGTPTIPIRTLLPTHERIWQTNYQVFLK